MQQSVIVTASAGAGKTTKLTSRVLELMRLESTPHILATTFTRAAAAEMQKKLLNLIDGSSEFDKQEKLILIMRAGRIMFSTLDAFFYTLLQTEDNIPEIAGERAERMIKQDAEKRFFALLKAEGLIPAFLISCRILGMQPDKLTEIFEKNASVQILIEEAGLDRLSHLKEKQAVTKESITGLQKQLASFSDQVTGNLKRWVIESLSIAPSPKDLCEKGALIKWNDVSYREKLGKSIEWTEEPYCTIKNLIEQLRSECGKYLLGREELKAFTLKKLITAWKKVITICQKEKNLFFFNDIPRQLLELDEGQKNIQPELTNRYYEQGFDRIDHLLIDEFQDTSPEQISLLWPLIEEIMSFVFPGGKGQRSLYMVGDWKQLIYEWRGANQKEIESILSVYSERLAVDRLPYNWRSTGLLVEFFNRLVAQMYQTEKKDDFQLVSEERKKSFSGLSEVLLYGVPGGRSNAALYEKTIELIIEKRKQYNCALGDMVILCRTNTHKDEISRLLSEAGIGFSEISGREFLATEDGVAVFLLLNYFFVEEGDAFLSQSLLGWGDDFIPLLRLIEEKATILAGFPEPYGLTIISRILSLCRGIITETVLHAVFEVAIEYFKEEKGGDAAGFVRYLYLVRDKVTVPEPVHAERVKIATIHGTKGLQFDHVVLLWAETDKPALFQASALGFPVSFSKAESDFLLSFSNSVFQSVMYEKTLKEAQIEEEKKNLLYVAITRAKKTLAIVTAETQKGMRPLMEKVEAILKQPPQDGELIENGWRCDYGFQEKREIPEYAPLKEETELRYKERKKEPVDPVYLAEWIEAGIARGNRLHRALSTLCGSKTVPDMSGLSEAEKDLIKEFLANQTVQEVIFRPGKVFVEQHISDTCHFGIVDRLILSEQLITIIDYKTGKLQAALMEKYQNQMERYVSILACLYPDRKIESWILALDEAKKGYLIK